MNLTRCLSCLLLVITLCHGGIQRVQSEAVEIVPEVPQMSTKVSAETDVENTKQPLRRAVELAVLKRLKLVKTKAKVRKLPKVARVGKLGKVAKVSKPKAASKPRFWRPKLKAIGSSAAAILGTATAGQLVAHYYDRFGLVQSPDEPQLPPDEEEQVEPAAMHYPPLAQFMISPAYAPAYSPAMAYPYLQQPQAAYPHPGYSNQVYQSRSYQNPINHQSQPEVPPQSEEDETDSSEVTKSQD